MAENKPYLLDSVVNAITTLSEKSGSTIAKITSVIKQNIENVGSRPSLRNQANEIHKAIMYGINNGLLQKQYNKILLVVKPNKVGGKQIKSIIKQRAKKTKRYEKVRPIRRHKSRSTTVSTDSTLTESLEEYRHHRTGIKSHRRRGRRGRRRRSRKGRRRRRRHMRRRTPTPANFERLKEIKRNIKPFTKPNLKGAPQDEDAATNPIQTNPEKQEKTAEPHNPNECDNPNCLCKMKNEPDDNNEYC